MNYTSFEEVIVRTPLHSLDKVQYVINNLEFEAAEKALNEFYENTLNKEALYVASPDLYNSLIEYQSGRVKNPDQIRLIVGSLFKYMTRMTTRVTPFGLFAGCSVGNISDKTELHVDGNQHGKKHTRLDMNFVCALAKEISNTDEIKRNLIYYNNTSLYTVGEKIRYIERKYNDTQVSYQISQVDINEYLSIIIDNARGGAKILPLINLLTDDDDITYQEAEEFIFDLIENQILVSELEPSVCGEEFYDIVVSILSKLNSNIVFKLNGKSWQLGFFVERLSYIRELLSEIDKNESNTDLPYKFIIDLINDFGIKFELNRLFQTDLITKFINCEIDKRLLNEVKHCLRVVNKLSIKNGDSRVENFAKIFYDRYEGREIPLMQALDIEYGIGYPEITENHSQQVVNKIEKFLFNKLSQNVKGTVNEIEIKEEELSDFDENWQDSPDTLACMVQLLKSNDKVSFLLLGAGGSSAANMISRFSLIDDNIKNVVKSIIAKEDELKTENVIYAEINHIPESRVGNILSRPILRSHEIPFLAKSNLEEKFQLELSDLMISVVQNKLIIRSQKNNKVVIPRLTNVHNYMYGSTQPVYKFLGDYQNYLGGQGVSFSWGNLEQLYTFFPRVTFKGNIISRSKWIFRKKDVDNIVKQTPSDGGFIESWRNLYKVPEVCLLVEGDNELLINFRNRVSVQIFISIIKNRTQFVLEEYLYSQYGSPIVDHCSNQYVNQLIFLFYRSDKNSSRNFFFKNLPLNVNYDNLVKREFLPGDEWLYFKIYCGTRTANDILIDFVKPLITSLKDDSLINQFFFIRYTDPEYHIRLRMKVCDINFVGMVLSHFYQNVLIFHGRDQVRKVIIDTYVRELERYGSDTIELFEKLFSINSEFVLNLISVVDRNSQLNLYAILYVDRLLNSFNISLEDKVQFMQNLSDGYGSEFNKDIVLKKKLGNQFRKEKNEIKTVLDSRLNESQDYRAIAKLVEYSLLESKECIDHIIYKSSSNKSYLKQLLTSYIHMFLNRIFIENPRYNEMVLYHMMWHHYRSVNAQCNK